MMKDWINIRVNIFDAFANTPQPDLERLQIIGCCEQHEKDFEWYRRHTWQEFENAIESRGFDPADFGAIHPLAFHYFTPGVLRTAIKRLSKDAEKYWHDESWIRHFIIAPYRLEEFKKEYLPLYTVKQRQAVSETLEWYQQWFLAQNGYDFDEVDFDEVDDDEEAGGKISEAIAIVWRGET